MATMPDSAAAAPAAQENRLEALDGLRGIAALIVFAHHVMVLYYGRLAGIEEHPWPIRPKVGLEILQRTPVGWIFNGAFAVAFFFVLSGFVLTRAMGEAPAPTKVARLVAARFLRLAPLVVLGTLAGYLFYGPAVAQLDALRWLTGTDSLAYVHPDLMARHNLAEAVRQAVATIWRGTHAERLFDPPLWSIGVELQGSLLVFLLGGAFVGTKRVSAKYWVGAAAGLCLMGSSSLSFLAGIYLAEASRKRNNVLVPVSNAVLTGLLALALVWASVHPWHRTLWLPLRLPIPELADACINTACAAFVMAAGVQLPWLRRLLSGAAFQFLGYASYGMYVVHVPILYLASAKLLAALTPRLGFHPAALTTAALCLAASLALGWALIKYVDAPLATRSKKWVVAWLTGE